MTNDWEPHETSTHQDHVIAHVLGATVLGYFEFDQAAHLLLDIGFIWAIYADGEMGLVPQRMAISEIELGVDARAELDSDAQALHTNGPSAEGLKRITPAPHGCLITEVAFLAHKQKRRVLVTGEDSCLLVDSSLSTGEVKILPAPK